MEITIMEAQMAKKWKMKWQLVLYTGFAGCYEPVSVSGSLRGQSGWTSGSVLISVQSFM